MNSYTFVTLFFRVTIGMFSGKECIVICRASLTGFTSCQDNDLFFQLSSSTTNHTPAKADLPPLDAASICTIA